MELIRVFVSHSSKDKAMAVAIAEAMNVFHMKPFLAHSDIRGGELWREELRVEIEKCDIVVALVTRNFHDSHYTEQEVGAAWVLKKPVLAVCSSGAVPTGFIAERQGLKYDGSNPSSTAESILEFALANTQKGNAADMLVDMLAESGSWKEASCLAKMLSREEELTAEQLERVTRALETNDQVRGSSGAKYYINQIMQRY